MTRAVPRQQRPFWARPFPQLYRCRQCGEYAVMWQPEPWDGHLCDLPDDFGQLPAQEFTRVIQTTRRGKWDLIAEGKEASELIGELALDKVSEV